MDQRTYPGQPLMAAAEPKKPRADAKAAASPPVAEPVAAATSGVATPAPGVQPTPTAPAAKADSGPGQAPGVDLEVFARNLARVYEEGGKVLSSYLKPREDGTVKSEMSEELTDMVKTLGNLAQYWMADPERTTAAQARLMAGYMNLWTSSLRRMAGEQAEPAALPDPKDGRFKDPEWSSNQFFDFVKQAYLITSRWAEGLVDGADGLDPKIRKKAEFYMRQIVSAAAPSNFVLTNPEVLRETLAQNADNLVRGMHMLAEDIQRGKGDLKLRQSDPTRFEVGRNMAITPGKVIYQNELMQLIQYTPTTEKVLKTPLLIVPPWINKYYILDLNPEKSFIKWCVDNGVTVFTLSWVNPDERLAQKGFDDYVKEGPLTALDVIQELTGEDEVHAIGYCVGGSLLAVTLALMAQVDDKRIKSATLFTTQVDFTYPGDLGIFVDEEQVSMLERKMAEYGYLPGRKMATAFNMLRQNDLIWPYVINNYLRGKAPFPFDLLYWNSDSTRMPAANHSYYLRNCYLNNTLSQGKMELMGRRLNLKDVTIPIYNLATREDHIAPAKSVFIGSRFFGGKVDFVCAGSGHIAGVINPPDKAKYQFWTGPKPVGDIEDWLKKAKEHPGSWWPHWLEWIRKQGRTQIDPRPVGSNRYPPIEDAPGAYVKMKD